MYWHQAELADISSGDISPGGVPVWVGVVGMAVPLVRHVVQRLSNR